ncbi:MAG: EAL domain-containing protein [Nitriliruptoraceae bacterium]
MVGRSAHVAGHRFARTRRRQLGSLVWTHALRSAVVFIFVGVVLHFVVQGMVERQFGDQAEFHAVFVTDTVLEPMLRDAQQTGQLSASFEAALADQLASRAVEPDDAVYQVTIWDRDGTMLVSSAPGVSDRAPDGYEQLVAQARNTGPFSVDGVAPHLLGDAPVASTLRTFVPVDVGHPLVAELHQDWTPTLAASREFSRTLDVGLFIGLLLLWALSLPILRRAGRQLHAHARTDDLTELPNRVALEERLDHALQRLGSTDACVAILFIDLDGFKAINDTYGHGVGDSVLHHVGAVLQRSTRASDIVARFAGDEFVVILENTDPVLSEQAARRILDDIRRPLEDIGGHGLTASIGMAVTDDPQIGADVILRHADAAMYQVKSDGGDNYCVFNDDLRDRVARTNQIEKDLRGVVDRGELHLQYQPFIDLHRADNDIVAVEALLRWTHPELGPVGPMEFIPLAERNGTIEEIGGWVLRQACHQLAVWQSDLAPDRRFVVHVNLSAVQLNERLLDVVDTCLRNSGADAGRLGLEVTETAMLESGDASITTLLEGLRERGCHVALDDFGTGYSSLSRLRAMPLDLLKLDGSFVHSPAGDGREQAILVTVVALARDMKIDVLAEGIETRDQLEEVAELGFDLGQGYYIARPSSADDVTLWLASGLAIRDAATVS